MSAQQLSLVVGVEFSPILKKYRATVNFFVDGARVGPGIHCKTLHDSHDSALEDGARYAEAFSQANAEDLELKDTYKNLSQEECDALLESHAQVLQ